MSNLKVENILRVLKVPFTIGIFHCIIQTVRSSETGGLQKSKVMTIYTLLTVIFYCWNVALFIANAPPSILDIFLSNGYTWFCVTAVDNILVKWVFLNGIFSAYLNRDNQILFYEKINSIDTILSKEYAESIDYTYYRFYAIFINVFQILYFLRICVTAVLNFSRFKDVTKILLINALFPFYLERICNSLLAFAYATDVLIIYMRFSP